MRRTRFAVKRGSGETLALQRLRERAGYSQAGLARKSGAQATLVREAETGERLLTVTTAKQVAPLLGTDWLSLYVGHNCAQVAAKAAAGESPTRAAHLARVLLELVESGQLSSAQRQSARRAVEEIAEAIEDLAARRGAGTLSSLVPGGLPDRSVEDEAQRVRVDAEEDYSAEFMANLDCDARGRKLPPKRPRKGGDSVDIDQDYIPESGEAALKSSMDSLGRDSFGRKLP